MNNYMYKIKRFLGYILSYSFALAFLSLSLGFLLDDFVRGYGVVACFHIGLKIWAYVQEEFRFY